MPSEELTLDMTALAILMPMYVRLDDDGSVIQTGPTAGRFFGRQSHFGTDWFVRTSTGELRDITDLIEAVLQHKRLFLRFHDADIQEMRGHGVVIPGGGLLLNFGFAVGLRDAVRAAGLTDSDFAPSELAMELLFLQEANSAVMDELASHNQQLEIARIEAEKHAKSDPLTGLANRRALGQALASLVGDASGPGVGGDGFALIHLDLDLFKEVNDSFGHAAGDEVLQHVADILRRMLRGGDVIARVGGDEFTVVLQGPCTRADVLRLCQRLIDDIEKPVHFPQGACRISASCGVALSTDYETPDPLRMSQDADAALYCAKRKGRGRAEIWDVTQQGRRAADDTGKC